MSTNWLMRDPDIPNSLLNKEAMRALNRCHNWGDADDSTYRTIRVALESIPALGEQDRQLEELWSQFEDVPMDPDTETIEEDFLLFPHGTSKEEIWHWFDERHSKGVYYLLYGADGVDRTSEIANLTYRNGLCFECMSYDCRFNHNGVCRFALVHEERPDITEDDGCRAYCTAL